MAGIIHGTLDMLCRCPSGGTNLRQTIFTAMYRALARIKPVVSLQYGSGGTGTGFWDEAAPFGDNAFAVFRFAPNANRPWSWYLMMQGSFSAGMGNAPGDPGLLNGGAGNGVCFAAATAYDGNNADFNPWLGTLKADGTDRKLPGYLPATIYALGARVLFGGVAYESLAGGNMGNIPNMSPAWWQALTGGVWGWPVGTVGGAVHVMPRSDNLGGTYNSIKQDGFPYLYGSSVGGGTKWRIHVFADDDAVAIYLGTDNYYNSYQSMFTFLYIGPYVPQAGNTTSRPLVMIGNWDSAINDPYSASQIGGIVTPNGVMTVAPDRYTAQSQWWQSPSAITNYDEYAEYPMGLVANETNSAVPMPFEYGWMGRIESPLFRTIYNAVVHRMSSDRRRIALTYTYNVPVTMMTAPWDGVTVPGRSMSRLGTDF